MKKALLVLGFLVLSPGLALGVTTRMDSGFAIVTGEDKTGNVEPGWERRPDTYNAFQLYSASVPTATVETFNRFGWGAGGWIGPSDRFQLGGGLTTGVTNAYVTGSLSEALIDDVFPADAEWQGPRVLSPQFKEHPITFVFDGPAFGFGMFTEDLGDWGGLMTLTVTDIIGNVTELVMDDLYRWQGSGRQADSVTDFIGILSETGMSRVEVRVSGGFSYDEIYITDIFGTGQRHQTCAIMGNCGGESVPEPSAALLFGVGLLSLTAMRRRQRT